MEVEVGVAMDVEEEVGVAMEVVVEVGVAMEVEEENGDDDEEEGDDLRNFQGDASESGGWKAMRLQLAASGRVPHTCHLMNAIIKSFQFVDAFGRLVSPFAFEKDRSQSIIFSLHAGYASTPSMLALTESVSGGISLSADMPCTSPRSLL